MTPVEIKWTAFCAFIFCHVHTEARSSTNITLFHLTLGFEQGRRCCILSCCCWSREEIHVPVHLLMSEMRPSDDERWHNINCEDAWTASLDCTSLTCYKCCCWWFRGLCHISLPYLIRCSTNPNFNINLFLFTNKTSYNICMKWCGKYCGIPKWLGFVCLLKNDE